MFDILSEHLNIPTNRTPDEIQRLLCESVVAPGTFKWWQLQRGHKPYEGEVADLHFHIRRVFEHRNDVAPYIDGIIVPSDTGAVIQVTIQSHRYIRIATILFAAFASLLTLCLVMIDVSVLGLLDFQPFIPFVAAVIICLISYFSFAGEAKQAKDFLYDLANSSNR